MGVDRPKTPAAGELLVQILHSKLLSGGPLVRRKMNKVIRRVPGLTRIVDTLCFTGCKPKSHSIPCSYRLQSRNEL